MPQRDLKHLPPIARAKAMHTRLPVDRRAHAIGLVVALLIVAAGLGYIFLWPNELRTAAMPQPDPGIVYVDVQPPAARPGEDEVTPAAP